MSRTFGNWIRFGLIAGAVGLGVAPASAQFHPEIPKAPGTGITRVAAQLPPTPIDTLTNSAPQISPPLPGTVADVYGRELAAREELTTATAEGNTYRFLPNTLLWEPPLAVKRDPRMQLLASNLENYRNSYTIDTSIGGTVGLFRYDFLGRDASVQVDIFGLVITRLSPDDLMAADYRFGLPITWQRGWWSGKIGYEHTSAHIGDEQQQARGLVTRSFAKDELVIGLSRILYEQLRVYGHVAYAFGFQVPDVETTTRNRSRADIGFEWYDRKPTGFWGTPFVAGNAEWRGDQDGKTNVTLQAGWLWKNPYQRFGSARIFVEHYRGQSPYGQFNRDRETFTSVGFGFDY